MRFIKDTKRNAAMNMAIDETLFNAYQSESVLRIYFWDEKYTTIGYFQKSSDVKNPVFTRRFTGGLTVNHHNDISYGFITSSKDWAYIYDQHETYRQIHSAAAKALLNAGIKCEPLKTSGGTVNNICIQTIYENDLLLEGRKILGSCLRRRGDKILVQGSLHLELGKEETEIFSDSFAGNIALLTGKPAIRGKLTETEAKKARKTAVETYLNDKWNYKF